MGRKSREKRERREKIERGEIKPQKEKPEIRPAVICRGIIFVFVGLALFTPIIISGKFFFPFVGPKSIFFMGCVEIMFTAWLVLIIFSKKYRPKFNPILAVLILFLLILILASVFGVDFSRSFWSKYERMTGLLMWFHLLAFFLVISSTFYKKSDWIKIFSISVFVATLIGFISLPGIEEKVMGDYPTRGGATIGNSSFLGTYLLFNIFLAIYLLLKTSGGLRVYSIISLAVLISALLSSGARAASLSFFGGLILLVLLWLIFSQKGKIRIAGISLFIIYTVSVLTLMYLALQPGNFVYEKLTAMASKSRLVVWKIGWKGFLERPWLGWGPENFELAFYKYFDPRLGAPGYGGEVWFDRAHNIIVDTLVASGIVGLLIYFGIFLVVFFVIWKKYFQNKLDFWLSSIISVILISYFVQNLTVFDMINSYLMFFLVLGFTASITLSKESPSGETFFHYQKISAWKKAISTLFLIIFCISFFNFIVQPLRTDAYVIQFTSRVVKRVPADSEIVKKLKLPKIERKDPYIYVTQMTSDGWIETIRFLIPAKRVSLYERTLTTSPLGKYQIREYMGKTTIDFYYSGAQTKVSEEKLKKEFDFISKELEKSTAESPLDYRAYLKLGRVYNAWGLYHPSKLKEAEKVLEKARELSPQNQQTYWVLAQTKLQQGDPESALDLAEKAVQIEPRVGDSHLAVVKIYLFMGDKEKAIQRAKEALKIVPSLKSKLEKLLGEGSLED